MRNLNLKNRNVILLYEIYYTSCRITYNVSRIIRCDFYFNNCIRYVTYNAHNSD